MPVSHLERIRRAFWTLGQPLTRVPAKPGVPVSDLFVWRNSSEWQTNFELVDIPGLFSEDGQGGSRYVTIYCFDRSGHCFLQERLDVLPNRRHTVEMATLVGIDHGEIGTFAVFHSSPPAAVTAIGSYLAERGYVSYRYRSAPLRAYVHGNLDAISLGPDVQLDLLGARSLLPREYRLQHEMKGVALYELGLVNPTGVRQRCDFQLVSTQSGKILEIQTVDLEPRGVGLIPYQIDESASARVIIKSRLVMARPLVFRIQNQRLDIFHG
jgi:hypothetical protein